MAEAIRASAPGRVNLIGEHTDYNDGYVLPVALTLRTRVEVRRRSDRRVRVRSDAAVGAAEVEFSLGEEERSGDWADYARGLTAILRGSGHAIGGFDAAIVSDLPRGAGLGSSAALLVSLLRALRAAFALPLDDLAVARLAREAETTFVGARVGLMDQLVASVGEPGVALFVDMRDLSRESVPLPREAELVVIDSGVRHAHAAGGYNARRAECEEAARILGVRSLREAEGMALSRLPPVLARRVQHVRTENARVVAAVDALRAKDAAQLGRLFDLSHDSQRDDYEVSTPEIERLVSAARADPDAYGARLTGGGFGGSVLVLARAGAGEAVGRRVLASYARRGGEGRLLLPRPAHSSA